MVDAASFFFNENDGLHRIQLMNQLGLQRMYHDRQSRNNLVYTMNQGQIVCIRKIRVQNNHVRQCVGIVNIIDELLTAFDQPDLIAIGHQLTL